MWLHSVSCPILQPGWYSRSASLQPTVPASTQELTLATAAMVWDRWLTLLDVVLLQCLCSLRVLLNLLERGGGDINLKPSCLIL